VRARGASAGISAVGFSSTNLIPISVCMFI